MENSIYCFGEVLWDVFPEQKIPGGAPMNVAITLNNLGFTSKMISRVGNDELGKQLLDFLKQKNCSTDFIQIDPQYPTGVVQVTANKEGHNSYEIIHPSAWDFIETNEQLISNIQHSKAFLFGSLAARSADSKKSLEKILNTKVLKIFDVNFRTPYFSKELIHHFLLFSDIVKMNDEELSIISHWHHLEHLNELELLKELSKTYQLQTLIITKGAYGACILNKNQFYSHRGYKVNVKDTVGSGDAFLAGFLSQYFKNKTIDFALEYACAIGALVATEQGANPIFSENNILNFIHNHQ